MPNKKLSQLPPITTTQYTDEIYVNQNLTSKKTTILKLKDYFLDLKVLDSILSGVTEASDASQIDITIDNYNTALTYDITVSVGTTSLTNGVITWTIPVLTEDALHTIDVIANFVGVMISSDIGFHSVNIYKDWRYRVVSSADPFKNGGLVAKYEMQADVSDTTGNYHGSNPDNLSLVAGFFGNCFEQDISNFGLLSGIFPTMTTFSISFRVNFSGVSSPGENFLVTGGGWGHFAIHSSSSSPRNFYVGTSSGSRLLTTNSPIVDGWNKIAITINQTDMRVYVNDDTPLSKTVVVSEGVSALSIGQNNFGDNIDQVEVYDYALTADEVDVLFNQNELLPLFN